MTNEAPAGPVDEQQTPPAPAAAPRRGASRIVTPILALVAALAIGLFSGILIGHGTASTDASARTGFNQGQGFRGAEGGVAGGGQGEFGNGAQGGTGAPRAGFGAATSGKIVSISGSSVVLKETSGTQVTVTTTSSTRVTKTTTSTSGSTTTTKTTTTTVSALKAGETIRVIGTASGSTVKATAILEGTAGALGGFRPGNGGNN